MIEENEARALLTKLSRSLFERGYSVGSSGNISMRVTDGFLITPTNSCLGYLEPEHIAKLDVTGKHVSGDKPSKEMFLHAAFYETRPATGAVVHLHSTYAVALSCLPDTEQDDAVPPLTPYVVMRVGKVKLIPYVRPGASEMGDMVRQLRGRYAAVLLANHGPVVSALDLKSAVYAAEELEETAKIALLLRGMKPRVLEASHVDELAEFFDVPR